MVLKIEYLYKSDYFFHHDIMNNKYSSLMLNKINNNSNKFLEKSTILDNSDFKSKLFDKLYSEDELNDELSDDNSFSNELSSKYDELQNKNGGENNLLKDDDDSSSSSDEDELENKYGGEKKSFEVCLLKKKQEDDNLLNIDTINIEKSFLDLNYNLNNKVDTDVIVNYFVENILDNKNIFYNLLIFLIDDMFIPLIVYNMAFDYNESNINLEIYKNINLNNIKLFNELLNENLHNKNNYSLYLSILLVIDNKLKIDFINKYEHIYKNIYNNILRLIN